MRGLLDGAGRATGIDFRDCEYFVGTSAGSIVAAFLAAGREPDSGPEARAAKEWGSKAGEANGAPQGIPVGSDEDGERGPLASAVGRIGRTAAAPFAPLALAGTAPGGAVARAAALAAVPRGKRSLGGLARLVEQSGASFDGRLRIAAVDRRNGKRVVFGAPGSPDASVAQAVLASCSIPWVFKPVTIDGREYVDGGVWSPTNLDATPARRGIEVLCLNPTAASRPLSSVSNAAALAESLALRARGARVRTLRPDHGAAEAMGHNLMDRSRVPEALAAGYAQGLALARHEPPGGQPRLLGRSGAGLRRDRAARLGRGGALLGHLEDPRGRRRRAAGRRRARRDRARLRHRLLLGLARPPRRAAGRDRPVARAARHRPRHAGRARPRVPAHRGRRRGGPAPRRELRLRPLRVRREPVVRPRPLDRGGRAAAAAGRAARLPHQLAAAGPVLGARTRWWRPTASRGRSSGSAASSGTTRRATRSSSTSPTARCCACCARTASRSRRCTSCRRPPDATSRFEFVTLEWARQWPCEEIWVARRE